MSKELILKCLCHCSYFEVEIDDEVTYLLFYKNNFYEGISLYQRIKNAFLTLIGKDYVLFDQVLKTEDVKEFSKLYLNSIPK